ncbi:adenylyl-sulfate kinase, partial [Streptomyces sp. NPDC018347]
MVTEPAQQARCAGGAAPRLTDTTTATQENHVTTGATVWLTGLPSAGKTT